MKETIRIKPLGLIKDLDAQDVGPGQWSNGYNIIFEDGRIRKSYGYTKEATLIEPTVLEYFTDGNSDFWIYADDSGCSYWDGTSHASLTPAGWGAGVITMADINGFPVINNTASGLYYWDFVAGTLLPYPDWPAGWRCEVIRSARQQLIALNVEDGSNYRGTYNRWSDVAAPGNIPQFWQPAADNLAGDFSLPVPEGRVIDGRALRDGFVVMKENSASIMRYVGGQFQWAISDLFKTSGCLARECAVELDNKLYVITQDDIIVTDGVNVESIADQQVKHAFFDNINPDLADLCYLQTDRNSEQLYVAFPDKDAVKACNRMFIYSYTDKTWTERLFSEETYCGAVGRYSDNPDARTWDNQTATWEFVTGIWNEDARTVSKSRLILGAIGALWKLAAVNQDDGVNIPVRVEKTGIDLGQNDRQKIITRVWPKFAEGNGLTVQIRVGAAQNVEDAPQWGPVRDFVIGQDRWVPATAQGRAGAIRIESSGDGHWALTGLEMDIRHQGRF